MTCEYQNMPKSLSDVSESLTLVFVSVAVR